MLTQRLRHRVDVERRTDVFASDGELSGHEWFTLYADVPAEVLTGPGREFLAANAKQSETSARMTLRYFPGLTLADRITWDGRTFDIQSIEYDLTARKEYRLRCVDGVSDGT